MHTKSNCAYQNIPHVPDNADNDNENDNVNVNVNVNVNDNVNDNVNVNDNDNVIDNVCVINYTQREKHTYKSAEKNKNVFVLFRRGKIALVLAKIRANNCFWG